MGAKTSGSRSTKICGGNMRGRGEREKGKEKKAAVGKRKRIIAQLVLETLK